MEVGEGEKKGQGPRCQVPCSTVAVTRINGVLKIDSNARACPRNRAPDRSVYAASRSSGKPVDDPPS